MQVDYPLHLCEAVTTAARQVRAPRNAHAPQFDAFPFDPVRNSRVPPGARCGGRRGGGAADGRRLGDDAAGGGGADRRGGGRRAGLDEGALPLPLSNLFYVENPYSYKKFQ